MQAARRHGDGKPAFALERSHVLRRDGVQVGAFALDSQVAVVLDEGREFCSQIRKTLLQQHAGRERRAGPWCRRHWGHSASLRRRLQALDEFPVVRRSYRIWRALGALVVVLLSFMSAPSQRT